MIGVCPHYPMFWTERGCVHAGCKCPTSSLNLMPAPLQTIQPLLHTRFWHGCGGCHLQWRGSLALATTDHTAPHVTPMRRHARFTVHGMPPPRPCCPRRHASMQARRPPSHAILSLHQCNSHVSQQARQPPPTHTHAHTSITGGGHSHPSLSKLNPWHANCYIPPTTHSYCPLHPLLCPRYTPPNPHATRSGGSCQRQQLLADCGQDCRANWDAATTTAFGLGLGACSNAHT